MWRACSTLGSSKQLRVTDDLERDKTQDLKKTVCSYNEWDPLEEVIVGRVEGKMFLNYMALVTIT